MPELLEGRVALVTGAGRGIGREHALSLARHGARVVVNDLGADVTGEGADATPAQEVVDEIVAAGGEAVVDGGDVSDFDAAGAMVARAIESFGRLDVLVNMDAAEWDAVIAVHLRGTFAPMRHAAAHWRERSKAGDEVDARIINTSSPSGLYGNVGQTNYGAAKAGIAAMTIIAAEELHRYGITVNAIAPGALTRMTEGILPDSGENADKLHPRWVAPIVTWLASSESRWVTGRVFDVSGMALSIAEGWHRGPTVESLDDPTLLGPAVEQLMSDARPNADMSGADREGPGRPTRRYS